MFAAGTYPVTGRFNLASPDLKAPDGSARVRSLSLRIRTPDGQEWRSAMINAPFFPVATPQAFYDLQVASADKSHPDALKSFAAVHPEIGAFSQWAGSAPFTSSYAEDRYNGINSFVFTNAQGQDQAVRWSLSRPPNLCWSRATNSRSASPISCWQTSPSASRRRRSAGL